MRSFLVVLALVLTAVSLLLFMPSPSRSADGAGSTVHDLTPGTGVAAGCKPQQVSFTAAASSDEQLVTSEIAGILRDAQERELTVQDEAVASQLTPLFEQAIASAVEDCVNERDSSASQDRFWVAGDHNCPPELLEETGGQIDLGPALEEEFEARMGELFLRALEEGREPTDAELEAVLMPFMDSVIAEALETLGDCLPDLLENS